MAPAHGGLVTTGCLPGADLNAKAAKAAKKMFLLCVVCDSALDGTDIHAFSRIISSINQHEEHEDTKATKKFNFQLLFSGVSAGSAGSALIVMVG
jgi:hypothetical protein